MSDLAQAMLNYATNGTQTSGRVATDTVTSSLSSKRKIRDINIRQLDHGFVVEIGCQTFAIESASTLIAKLSEYILLPEEIEVKWAEGKLF